MNENVSFSNTTNLVGVSTEGSDKLVRTFADILGDMGNFLLSERGFERKLRRTNQKRLSEAKTEIEILSLKDEYEIELAKRTAKRLILEEMQNQENFEDIAKNSIKFLPEKISDKPVDKTWARKFFDKSKMISDEDIQEYWSKVLAGEITDPGTYSLKSLNILEEMDKEDIILFQKICNVVINKHIFYYEFEPFMNELSISYDELKHLAYLGLLNAETFNSTSFNLDLDKIDSSIFNFNYDNDIYTFQPMKSGNFSIQNSLFLTKSGFELSKLNIKNYPLKFVEYIIKKFKNQFPNSIITKYKIERIEDNLTYFNNRSGIII